MKETISREEFNNMDREVLYTLFTGMQEQLRKSLITSAITVRWFICLVPVVSAAPV